MAYYRPIKDIIDKSIRKRTIDGLQRLRKQLDEKLPEKTRHSTLILGTFNIRNFDDNRFMHGPRTQEDLHYLAEIISRFDVLAVQEINEDLKPLDRLMYLLGRDYEYIMTDITEGRSGNRERMGYIYDKSKVKFKGVAGELVLPDNMQIIDGEKKRQFSRTPFMCSFQAEWFKFLFTTVHIYFGSNSGPKYERRVEEIDTVSEFLAKRADKDDQNHILVGDFNIKKPGSDGYNALEENGFKVNKNKKGSNKDQTKYYDQISFRVRENELQLSDSPKNSGVFQFFDSIYRADDFLSYRNDVVETIDARLERLGKEIDELIIERDSATSREDREETNDTIRKKEASVAKWKQTKQNEDLLKDYYLKEWRTFRASDHLPLWVELKIDFSSEYLEYLETL